MNLLVAIALSSALVATPGALDFNGGHVDLVNGQYHVHAAPSTQYRYIDGAGRLLVGNSPMPVEVTTNESRDIWSVGLVFAVLIGGIGAFLFAAWLKPRLVYHHLHHHHGRRHHHHHRGGFAGVH